MELKLDNKYNVGDIIWFIADNKIVSEEITEVRIEISIYKIGSSKKTGIIQWVSYKTCLWTSRGMLYEHEIYPNRKGLLKNM